MNRRDLIALAGGAAASSLSWPLAARAQQPALPVVALLSPRSIDDSREFVSAFQQGLNQSGFVDGRNVAVEYHSAADRYDLMPGLAAELVRRQVAVIVAVGGSPPGLAAKAATSTIPVVFIVGGDPVKLGLVASLARPGGNVTGVTILSGSLTAKRLELLRELVPNAAVMAVLVNPVSPEAATQLSDVQTAAHAIGQEVIIVNAGSERELDSAFAGLPQRAGALLVANDGVYVTHRRQIVALAARHAIPAIHFTREFVAEGGLMSYGNSLADSYRRVGIQTAKILNGARPGDLPVEQTVKVELVLNLPAAKALGLSFPLSLLGRADEVIE
jgi:putative ABC transport system substrate-binding protein